jgi:hypothetical protein
MTGSNTHRLTASKQNLLKSEEEEEEEEEEKRKKKKKKKKKNVFHFRALECVLYFYNKPTNAHL